MNPNVLTADGHTIASIPRGDWETELHGAPEAMKKRLAFMTPDHHRVRRFAVAELPRRGKAITAGEIASALSLPVERVSAIVAELERALFFVVRTRGSAVSWAFPVTVDETPHSLAFSTGERCFAA